MRTSDIAITLALGAALVLVPRMASASPVYPGELAKVLDMQCPPPCTICHKDLNGGFTTAIKPFADTMYEAGLRARDVAALGAAVAKVSSANPGIDAMFCPPTGTEPCDNDGDGVGDVEELRAGTDPNGPGELFCSDLTYGCARIAPRMSDRTAANMVGAGLLVILARRKRRARER